MDNKGKTMTPSMHAAGDDKTLNTMGGRIRAVRKARGLRVTNVAKEIGVSRTSYSLWEADAVKHPDHKKLGMFAKMSECSLDWLIAREGPDPDLTPPQARRRRSSPAAVEPPASPAISRTLLPEQPIPEIAAPLAAHAKGLDLTAKAYWNIPHQILELGFSADPQATVVKRIATRGTSHFNLSKGDYVLIDASRTRVDEPGMYIAADPAGQSALRVLVADKNGKLEVQAVADDLLRNPQVNVDNLKPLGRVMGILKPA